jgi:feruloyl-CoA synthase
MASSRSVIVAPNLMPGYWRHPEANAQAFDAEGWFRSGDAIAFVDPDRPDLGFRFDGRIAEDFKLATGTWVSVGPLRQQVIALGDPYIQDIVVCGLDRDEIGVLVFPRLDACHALSGLPPETTPAQVLTSLAVRAFFADLLARQAACATGSASRVARALLLAEPAAIDRGEVTDKGSINQRAVLTHRAEGVAALYDDGNPELIVPAV